MESTNQPPSPAFFFTDTATTEIYTLSLHDALPICALRAASVRLIVHAVSVEPVMHTPADRKSTRLNSSHSQISYAAFCLKQKKPPIPFCQAGLAGYSDRAMRVVARRH